MKLFKRKKEISIDVAEFSGANVSTGQVGYYIKKLYEEEGFIHIGYRFENKNGLMRVILYTIPPAKTISQYFKDRCPAMIEKECKECEPRNFTISRWNNGFEEVAY